MLALPVTFDFSLICMSGEPGNEATLGIHSYLEVLSIVCWPPATGAGQMADARPIAVARQMSGPGQMTDVDASINFPQTGKDFTKFHSCYA